MSISKRKFLPRLEVMHALYGGLYHTMFLRLFPLLFLAFSSFLTSFSVELRSVLLCGVGYGSVVGALTSPTSRSSAPRSRALTPRSPGAVGRSRGQVSAPRGVGRGGLGGMEFMLSVVFAWVWLL